jgi:5-hydroxyisourate hydrolase
VVGIVSGISTHVLDVSRGVAAAGVGVVLERGGAGGGGWTQLTSAATDADGRVKSLLPAGGSLDAGEYRLRFATGAYWKGAGVETFHPVVEVTFTVVDASRHHHVPLLVSPFGYSTYRGT